ncbi:hypothetical protein [Demequina subtropica]|uniref:hypothetical protein n=1 Tax=Demequina subtropica TaxID=1638989 RepID=UPI0007809F1B|nr:hypothetical protein [Demequina subtropica]
MKAPDTTRTPTVPSTLTSAPGPVVGADAIRILGEATAETFARVTRALAVAGLVLLAAVLLAAGIGAVASAAPAMDPAVDDLSPLGGMVEGALGDAVDDVLSPLSGRAVDSYIE